MKPTGLKAASAALTIISAFSHAFASLPCESVYPIVENGNTIPALPEETEAFQQASRAFRSREMEAPILLKDFLNSYPASLYVAEVRLMLADWYFYNKEYPMALSYYRLIPDSSFSGDVRSGELYRKAFSMVKTGYYSEARSLFTKTALSKAYGNASRFYLAYLDYVDEKYDEAYDAFKAIKNAGYKETEADYYLNQIEYMRGNFRKVASTSSRLLSESIPDEMLAQTLRVGGISSFRTGDRETARNTLSRYVELTGDGAEFSALYTLGVIFYDEGRYDEALPLFKQVTEFDGALAQSAWLYIGQILSRQGDAQGAALAYSRASEESWDPGVAETAAYNAAVGAVAGSALPFSDVAGAMEGFIDSYPSSRYAPVLSGYLANSYYNLNDYEGALRQLEKIKNPGPEVRATRQKVLYQLGVRELQQGKTAESIRHLAEAAAGPDADVSAQSFLWLGDAYYSAKEFAKSVKAYNSAISGRLGNNESLAYYNLGYAYMKLKDYKNAEAVFKKAVSTGHLTPQQLADARLRYADCLYYNGKYAEALALFKDIRLDGGQNAVYAQIREADILGRNGRVEEKISLLERIATDDAGIWRSTVISRLADAYSEKGDDRKAAELYARMLDNAEKGSDSSQTYFSLAANADNLYNGGDYDAAYSAYKRLEKSGIRELYPMAIVGIARTSDNQSEVFEYATTASSLPGLTAEEMNEMLFLQAQSGLSLGSAQKALAMATLAALADSSDRYWGARAAVILGQQLLDDGEPFRAEEVLTALIDKGSDDNYWLARGYIVLADTYTALDKDYLAKLYLESLRNNYPGKEKDIKEMINSRLK